MYFLIDSKLKIAFGWSGKCGCSHIKKIFLYLTKNINDSNTVHHSDKNSLPVNIKEYTIIIITRNPFDRLVSGFLEKYYIDRPYNKKWPFEEIKFSVFVNYLIKKDWNIINKHHFIQQTSENFNYDILKQSKKIIIYDIKNINYNYIQSLYKKKIPNDILNFKGSHIFIKTQLLEKYVYNLDMKEYFHFKVPTKYFYNDILKQKIYSFYKKDFMFFKKFGINYKLE